MISDKVAISFGEETNISGNRCWYNPSSLADRVEGILSEYGFVKSGAAISEKCRRRDYAGTVGKISVIFSMGFGLVYLMDGVEKLAEAPVFVEFRGLDKGLVGEICDCLSEEEL